MLHNPSHTPHWLLLTLLITLLPIVTHCNFIMMGVTPTVYQINQPSTYSFTINRQFDPVNSVFIPSPTPVSLNSLIKITFPTQFLTISNTPSITCSDSTGNPLTCSLNSATRIVTVNDYYATSATLSDSNILLTMNNIINAYISGTSTNFYWEITDSVGTIIDQGPPVNSNFVTTSITFTGGTFTSCAVTAAGAFVGTHSAFIFTLIPKNQIPSGGQLVISIPNSWGSDPISSSTIANNPTCTEVSGIGSTNLACSYNSQNAQLTLTGLTQTLSTSFSFSISTVLTPPTVGSGQLLSIFSQWADGTAIDSCTSLITGLVAAPLQAITLASNDNTTVQSSFTAQLQITLSRPFSYLDSIIFILPTEFQSASVSSINFATFTRTPSLNTLTLSNFPSVPSTITSNNLITFTLTNIQNALSISPLSLNVSFYRSNQIYQTDITTYSATVGTPTSFVITPNSNFVQALGIATFTIDSTILFPTGSTTTITYPASLTANSLTASSVSLASLNGTVVIGATFQISNNQIIIRSLFNTDFKGTIIVRISTFTNPPTTQPSTYLFSVTDANNFAVMSSSYLLTANTKSLIANSVTSDSFTVLQISTYTITISTNYDFTAVSILVPTGISIGTGFETTCAPNTFSSCTLVGTNLTFIGTLTAGTHSLSWGYNTNPNSLQSTPSFIITTYYQGWSVQNSQGVISLTMNSTAVFRTLNAFPSSYSNSAVIQVTLNLLAPAGAPPGTLTATFPPELGLSSASCSGCTIVPPSVLVTLSASITNFTLVVSNVQNVGSFKPISSFTVSIADTNSFTSISSTTVGWTNTLPSSFSSTVVGTNNYRGQANNFIFSLSGLPGSQSYIRVTINSAFPAIATAPTGYTLVDSHNLDHVCTSTSCSLNIPLTDPTAIGTYTFTLNTFTVDNYQVGTSTSNSWTYQCSGTQCRSCLTNNSCIDCYSSLISSFSILNTAFSTCTSACSSGFFLISTICTPCDTNCSTCINAAVNCTSCAINFYLDLTYLNCVPTCLSGQFANAGNLQCNTCTNPCSTCITTATSCLSCVSGTYLFGNTCPSSCPSGTHINNAATNNCDPCDPNCLTCSSTTTNCLTCNNTLNLYFQNNKCVATCSSNYFIVNNICTYCISPCRICGVSTTDCTACFLNSTASIYYNNHCISIVQCPTGHYINNTNSSCQACPTQCSSCSSPTACSVCNTSYFLSGASCLATCVNTTYPFSNTTSGYCLPCNNCNTCSDASTCTSCITSQYLYLGICYTTCPTGTFTSGSLCTICDANCPSCQNVTYCNSCVSNMFLLVGTCYSTCPAATYPNTTSILCQACPSTCTTCTSLTNCQTCTVPFSIENNNCVSTCSVGLSVNQTCYPCGLSCATCSANTGICSLCSTNYLLYNNTCLTQCPANTLTNDLITCVPCTTNFVNCSTCSNSLCLSCNYGQLVNGSCKPCDPGSYDLSGTCALCPSTCTTCTAQTTCQTCAINHYLHGTICTGSCPTNMIPNGTICSECSPLCSICNLANSLCSVCIGGVYLHNNLCYSTCPSPLIVSYDFLSCVTLEVYYQQFSQAAKIIYFPFSIAAVVLVILGLILRCFHPRMHLPTVLCSLISTVELASWGIFLVFEYVYWQNFHQASKLGFYTGIVSIALLYLFNVIHLKFVYSYAASDDQFSKWHKHYGCTNCILLSIATMFTFKFYRLIHSKFLGRNELSMTLSSTNKLVPFSLLSVLALFLCSIPIGVGCALALYNSIAKDQEFFIALDTLVVTGIMALLILMDLRYNDDYFTDQHQAQNLKRKIYEEDEFKFDVVHGGGDSQSGSAGNIGQADEVQGENALPSTGQKFTSTFQHTKLQSEHSQAKLDAINLEDGQYQFEQSQTDQPIPTEKGMWQPVKYDHHGYQIKRDTFNNPVLYDQFGNTVVIDEDGTHKRYNADGNLVKVVDGKQMVYDKDGYLLVNGKPHDDRGYEVREQDGEKVFYDQNGFRVVGQPPDEKHLDEDGNLVTVDQDGNFHRFNEDGYEIVDHKGKKLLKDSDGNFVRKNAKGQWQKYDPQDGFTLRPDPKTGQLKKYDQLGFRVQKDQMGNIKRYDQDGFLVNVLPGDVIVRYDADGYRIVKDEDGKIHRFDDQGYELVTDEEGRPKFIDQHGYRVQRDLYGRVSLYDDQGFLVVIDPDSGKVTKYNDEGLEVTTDDNGKRVLKDKRGKIVKQMDETFQKYDEQGNKIYLDQNGYEVEYDPQGNIVLYDKIGDRVDSDYDVLQSDAGDNFQSTLMDDKKKKAMRYRYKPSKEVDNQAELDKLMTINQPFTFEQESEVSELREFHDYEPPLMEVDNQIDNIINKERTLLVVEDQDNQLNQLVDFEREEELDDVKEEEGQIQGFQGGKEIESKALVDETGHGQQNYDKQAVVRDLDENQPEQALKREARKKEFNRMLNAPRDQEQIQIKSVADVGLNERSFENEGVDPLDNKTQYDQLDSIGQLEVPLGKTRRGGKKTAQTQYNFNTVDIQIKNQNKLYDQEEEIQSLHQDQWQQQQPVFARQRVKEGTSNANTNILFVEEQSENKDALSDFVQHQSQTNPGPKAVKYPPRYPPHEQLFSGRSIQQIEQQLFQQADARAIRERKQFKLSGAPNPLVQYSKAMQQNRKSIQQKMYFQNTYKK